MAKPDPETSALKEQLADAVAQIDSLQAGVADAEARAASGCPLSRGSWRRREKRTSGWPPGCGSPRSSTATRGWPPRRRYRPIS